MFCEIRQSFPPIPAWSWLLIINTYGKTVERCKKQNKQKQNWENSPRISITHDPAINIINTKHVLGFSITGSITLIHIADIWICFWPPPLKTKKRYQNYPRHKDVTQRNLKTRRSSHLFWSFRPILLGNRCRSFGNRCNFHVMHCSISIVLPLKQAAREKKKNW